MKQMYPKRVVEKECCERHGPKQGSYYWEGAYADASATHAMLPSYIYDSLGGKEDRSYLRKYYSSYKEAIRDLKYILSLLEYGLKNYSNLKEEE